MAPGAKRSRKRRPSRRSRREPQAFEATVEIESLAAGGDGVGRLEDGRVVFVRLAAPGDRVRIQQAEVGSSFLRASAFELLEPGAARREPQCEVFGRCGGCAWQHVDREVQLEARRTILRDALARIAKLDGLPTIECVASPDEYAYRGRARVVVQGGRVGLRRAREHEIEALHHCPVLRPELDRALDALATRVEAGAVKDCEIELALDQDGSVLETPLPGSSGVGNERAKRTLAVGGERLQVTGGGFAQANPALFDAMYDGVSDALAAAQAGTLIEFYAGSGFFTVGLARRFERVIAIEQNATACRDLEQNLARAGLDQVEVQCARVEDAIPLLAESAPDAVLLDPPRAGLAREAAMGIANLGAAHIAYLSCDPATLARDLALLCRDAGRYRLKSLTVYDVFPQTPHVEALAVLER